MMKTSKILRFGFLGIATCCVLSMCTKDTCEDLGTCPIAERIDISISGDMNRDIHFYSMENDENLDLISYHFYGIPSDRIDFILNFDNIQKLKISLINTREINPWEHTGIDYATYPTQELDDKWQYVTATLVTGVERPAYSTNLGDNYPPGANLGVFSITEYDGVQIRCRIRDMLLYKNTDPASTITINGTFVGAVTFLDEHQM